MATRLNKTLAISFGVLCLVSLNFAALENPPLPLPLPLPQNSSSAVTDTPVNAVAVLIPNNNTVSGTIMFTQLNAQQAVQVSGNITGLKAGKHGFHIHQNGDLTGGCASTGSHFDPKMQDHGAPEDEVRHVGDLGNVVVDDSGVAVFSFDDPRNFISLFSGVNSIVGRGVVVHTLVDDLGRGGNNESKKTGNADGRQACGVIGLQAITKK